MMTPSYSDRRERRLRKFDFRRGCRVKVVSQSKTAVAADAGPMHIQSKEGTVSRCAEAVRGSAEGNTACPGAGRGANRSQTESVEKREGEICLVTRRRTADRAEARRVFAVWRVVSCSGRDHEGRSTKLLEKKGLKGAAVSKKLIGLGSSGRSYVGANRPGGLPNWKIVQRKTIRFVRTRLGCIRLLTREVKTEIPAPCRFHGDPSCPLSGKTGT